MLNGLNDAFILAIVTVILLFALGFVISMFKR